MKRNQPRLAPPKAVVQADLGTPVTPEEVRLLRVEEVRPLLNRADRRRLAKAMTR